MIRILHEELCDPRLLNYQNFPLWARLAPVRLLQEVVVIFSLQADVTISVFREVSNRCCAYPSLVPLLLAAPLVIHEKRWESIDVVEHSYPPDSP